MESSLSGYPTGKQPYSKIEQGAVQSSDTKELNRIKAEALVLRGLALFNLTRLFGMPYMNDNGASLGVPIELKPEEPAHQPKRNTVAECYEQVVADITTALPNLRTEKPTVTLTIGQLKLYFQECISIWVKQGGIRCCNRCHQQQRRIVSTLYT